MKMKTAFFALLLTVFASYAGAQSYSDSTMARAWVLGSKLSLAGTLYSQGGDAATVDRQFAAASDAAASFGLKLPALPARTGDRVKDSAAVLAYLLKSTGDPIRAILAKSYGSEHAATFEIALKSNMLLILYGPGESSTNAIANVIRSRTASLSFLNEMMAKLLELIDQKASFEQVKAELFNIHEIAPQFIAVIEFARTGEAKYAERDYASSASAYTKAISIDPTEAEYYFGRGRAYMQLDRNSEAIADYTKVIQLEGKTPNAARNLSVAFHNRGLLYGMTGKYAAAIADLSKAIDLSPDYASAFKVRGLVYKQIGNSRLAASDLQRAEQLQAGITR
jgi:tetratricopeptide (TPR) repeat protein